MKRLLEVSLSVLFFTSIFSFYSSSEAKTVQEIIEERCNKSIFTKIKCKTEGYNPVDYLEKRKRCIYIRDTADTVFEGKRRYKNCMKN